MDAEQGGIGQPFPVQSIFFDCWRLEPLGWSLKQLLTFRVIKIRSKVG